MVKKYLIYDRFDFLDRFSDLFDNSDELFNINWLKMSGLKGVCNFKITWLFQSLFSNILIIFKDA